MLPTVRRRRRASPQRALSSGEGGDGDDHTFALGYFARSEDERGSEESAGGPAARLGRPEQHRPYKECNARANVVSAALAHFCH